MPPQQATSSATLQDRLLALAQTLQFAWFVGHVTLLLCTLRYALSVLFFNQSGGMAKFCYRTSFVAALTTYGIVVYKAFRAKVRQNNNPQQAALSMVGDENVQYYFMALVWLFSRQITLAIAPFAVYSLFHVATYTRSNLLPAIQPQQAGKPASGLGETIGAFVKQYYDSSMTLVATLEIFLFVRLLGGALLFQKGSWILLGIYTVFFRFRHSQSSFMQSAFSQLTARLDTTLANQSTPPAVRQGWEQVKQIIRQAADATDPNRYLRPQGAPKKAQ